MINVAIDFESYYDKDCTIKKLGVSQYVKHPDFFVICLGVKIEDGPVEVLTTPEEIEGFFRELDARDEDVNLIAHNMPFDGYVASYIYGYVPEFYTCTQSMCNALFQQFTRCGLDDIAAFLKMKGKHAGTLDKMKGVRDPDPELMAELVEYNKQDVEVLWNIYQIVKMDFPERELGIIDLTIRMFTQPLLLVDGALAQKLVTLERREKEALAEANGAPESVFRSSPKFAKLLEERGYDVPYKRSEALEKDIPALAQDDIPYRKMREKADKQLLDLFEARKRINSHLLESRARGLLARADEPLPVGLRYCAAHTMRFGGTDRVNLQNLPSKGVAGQLRDCLRAPPGYKLVIVDAAQIEARVNAWLAGQDDLVEQFMKGMDVYSIFASDLFHVDVTKATHPRERYIGKTCILGLGYQMSAPRLKDELYIGRGGPSLTLPIEECQFFVDRYRTRYNWITQQWYRLDDMISVLRPQSRQTIEYGPLEFSAGRIKMPNGLSLYYPNVHFWVEEETGRSQKGFWPHGNKEATKLWGGMMTENIVQSLARTITSGHMYELSKLYRVVLMAHDEIIMCVPEKLAEQCLADALDMMKEPAPGDRNWAAGMPLAGEGEIADHYLKPD